MKKILIIEDDDGISSSLKLYLENSNFEVFLHNEGLKATEQILKLKPDLVILDINLPGKDGIEITKEYREKGTIPIIMLTARSGELDRINGLEIGADDYIAKPFSPRELLARINTIIRRIKSDKEDKDKNDGKIKCKDLVIDTSKKTIEKGGVNINLTGNEYDIIKKLVEENGKIVSRETIMTEIIGYDNYVYDRTIDTHIKNLRKKLDGKKFILTIRGEGYRINI